MRYVSAGSNFTAAIDVLGQLWTCGAGYQGRLGHGNDGSKNPDKHVKNLKLVTTIPGGQSLHEPNPHLHEPNSESVEIASLF